METQILRDHQYKIAARILKEGGIVAIPTETVYGLAANALDPKAIAKIFRAKGRPMDNPLIVHIAEIGEIYDIVSDFPEDAKLLASAFWPGPLTIILPKSDIIPHGVSAGLDTVAVRMPSHPIARSIIRASGVPLAAPSANLSGSPSPTSLEHVINDMNGKIDAIVDGDSCIVGIESTVITLATKTPKLLRPGGITVEEIEKVIGKIEIDNAVLDKLNPNIKPSSPGMKYKHYAPKANVVIIKGNQKQYVSYVNKKIGKGIIALCFDEDKDLISIPCVTYGSENDSNQQANLIFDSLRKTDNMDIDTVYARCPNMTGVGMAVYNRLIRAAGFEVIDLE